MNEQQPTWKEFVQAALNALDGKAKLSAIYKAIASDPATEEKRGANPTWQATVRRTLQVHAVFYQTKPGSGVWELRSLAQPPLPPEPGQEIKHEEAQGILVTLGRLYGHEAYVPVYDRQKRFAGEPLDTLASLKVCPRLTYPKIIKRVSTIDVMWFKGEGDTLFPHSGFEVEFSEGITKDLVRFLDLHRAAGEVNLFVVTVPAKLERFARELEQTSFAPIRAKCRVRQVQDLVDLYNEALKHASLSSAFLGENAKPLFITRYRSSDLNLFGFLVRIRSLRRSGSCGKSPRPITFASWPGKTRFWLGDPRSASAAPSAPSSSSHRPTSRPRPPPSGPSPSAATGHRKLPATSSSATPNPAIPSLTR